MKKISVAFLFLLFLVSPIKAQLSQIQITADSLMFVKVVKLLSDAEQLASINEEYWREMGECIYYIDPRPLIGGDIYELDFYSDSLLYQNRLNILKKTGYPIADIEKDYECMDSGVRCVRKSFNTIAISILRPGGAYAPAWGVDEYQEGVEKNYYTVRIVEVFNHGESWSELVFDPRQNWEVVSWVNLFGLLY